MPNWPEEEQRAWRLRAAKYIHTHHSLDDPCKLGRSHYGGCWYQPPELDELIREVHKKRLNELIYGDR